MINLNDNKYLLKDKLSTSSILKYISDYDIFKYYIPGIELNTMIHSPFRKDSTPSFNIFWYNASNRIYYKDLGTGEKGDCFTYVQRIKNCSFRTALSIIVKDFQLDNQIDTEEINYSASNKQPIIYDKSVIQNLIKSSTKIQITVRDWLQRDLNYWGQYGICKDTLLKYRVTPIKYLFINDEVYHVDKLAYAYTEYKDDVIKYKIYQPMLKKMKWVNNFVDNTLSGFSQLPESGDLLIIASSLKDAMCIHDLGYTNVIAPQTENYIFKEYVLNDLKKRFKRVVLFYDHDEAGLKASEHMKELFGLEYITTGVSTLKDPSDYYKSEGYNKLLNLINNLL